MRQLELKSKHTRKRGRAFTLAELLVSSAIMGILMLGMAASIQFAGAAAEDVGTSSAAMVPAVDVLDRITTDLEEAIGFTIKQTRRVALTVPDRNKDGIPEQIEYSWSGTPGDPLLCVVNGSAATTLASKVHHLDFSYMVRTVRQPMGACCLNTGSCIDATQTNCESNVGALYNGDGTTCATSSCLQESAVQNLFSYDTTASPSKFDLLKKNWPAQYFKPTLPINTVSWKITHVKIKAALDESNNRTYYVKIFGVDLQNKPTGSELSSVTLNSSTLPSNGSLAWVTATLPTPLSGLDPAKTYAVVVTQTLGDSEDPDVEVAYHGSAPSNSSRGWTTSKDAGVKWSNPVNNKSLLFFVDGTYTTLGPPQ